MRDITTDDILEKALPFLKSDGQGLLPEKDGND
jgi:hypothetical protein